MKLLNQNNMDSNIRFVYDGKSTNKMPITLQLKTNLLDLTFDSMYQKLILIELKSWNEFTSFYHNNLPLINESASSSSSSSSFASPGIATTTTSTTPLISTAISPTSSQSFNTTSTNTSTNISANTTTATSDNSCSNSISNSISNSQLQPNFKSLYNKIFGPTYPGYYDTVTKSYLLSYPGICFKFIIPDSIVSKFDQFEENPHDENLIRLLDRYSTIVNCSSFVIFKGQSWHEELVNLKSIISNNTDLSLLPFSNNLNLKKLILNSNINFNKLSSSNNSQIVIENCHVIIPLGLIFIKFLIHNKNYNLFKIEIGKTTMHDVIRNLGQPSNYLNKLVDSNSMNNYNDINGIITSSSTSQSILTTATTTNHANSSNTNNTRNGKSTDNANNNTNNTKNNNSDENIIIKIHNYFDFGLDFIYDTSKSINGSCPIKKIVIHNNPINSLEFGNYEKLFCYFTGYNNKINLLQKEFNNLQKKNIKLTNNISNTTITNNNNINNTKITPTSYSPFASDIPRPTPINSNFMSSSSSSSSSATTTNKTATTNKTITANKTTTNTGNDFKNLDEDQFKIYKKLIFDVNVNENKLIDSNDLYKDFTTDFNNKLNQPVFLNREKFQLNNSGWDNSGTVQSFSNFEVIDFEDEFEDDNTLSISNHSMSCDDSTTNNNHNSIPDDESSKIVKDWGLSKLYGIERCIFEILIDNGSISGVTLF